MVDRFRQTNAGRPRVCGAGNVAKKWLVAIPQRGTLIFPAGMVEFSLAAPQLAVIQWPPHLSPDGYMRNSTAVIRLVPLIFTLSTPLLVLAKDQPKKDSTDNQAPGWGQYWTGENSKPSPFTVARRAYLDAIRQKNYREALAQAEKMVSIEPSHPGAYAYRAVAKGFLHQFESARADLNAGMGMAKREGSRELTAFCLAAYGQLAVEEGRPAEAPEYYRKAIKEAPHQPSIYNNFAWLLATSRTSGVRNGPEAIRLATKACELSRWSDPSDLDTLAAAYAESGDFASAAKWQAKAVELLPRGNRNAVDLNARLILYKNKQPYRSDK